LGVFSDDDFFIYFNQFAGMFVSFLLGWILCRKKYQLLLKKYKTNPDTIQTIKLPIKAGGLDDSKNKEKALITVPNKEAKNTTRSTILATAIKSSNIIRSIFYFQIKRIIHNMRLKF
jgi:hypothetical protein